MKIGSIAIMAAALGMEEAIRINPYSRQSCRTRSPGSKGRKTKRKAQKLARRANR
jgi:hypothetical protein